MADQSFSRNYELARLHAEVKALQYENKALTEMVKRLALVGGNAAAPNVHDGSYQYYPSAQYEDNQFHHDMVVYPEENLGGNYEYPSTNEEQPYFEPVTFTKADFEDMKDEDEEEENYDEWNNDGDWGEGEEFYEEESKDFYEEQGEDFYGEDDGESSDIKENLEDNFLVASYEKAFKAKDSFKNQNAEIRPSVKSSKQSGGDSKTTQLSVEKKTPLNGGNATLLSGEKKTPLGGGSINQKSKELFEETEQIVKTLNKKAKKFAGFGDDIEEPIELDHEGQISAMNELFGSSANKVLAAETELQLEFDRYCEENQASLWPCLPLNMKFD